MYDADKCLADIVRFARSIIEADNGKIELAIDPSAEMAAMIVEFDNYLGKGGRLPEQWARKVEKNIRLKRFAMFNPDKCLDEVVRLSNLVIESERKNLHLSAEPSNALADCFRSLNEWLENGGQVPERWRKRLPQAAALHPAA